MDEITRFAAVLGRERLYWAETNDGQSCSEADWPFHLERDMGFEPTTFSLGS